MYTPAEFKFVVYCDQGFGRCYSRLAVDMADAQKTMDDWMVEGIPLDKRGMFRHGGEFSIHPYEDRSAGFHAAFGAVA